MTFLPGVHITNKDPQAWRAAWIVGHCSKKNEPRLVDYVDDLISSFEGKKDGHQRELLKLIYKTELNESQEGILFHTCMTIWESVNKSPSVRSFAFRFIAETAKKYPELKEEISFLTQDQYLETLSPGIRKGVEKLIKEIL